MLKKLRLRSAGLAGALMLCACASVDDPGNDYAGDRDFGVARELAISAREQSQAPALSVAVLKGDEIIWSEAFGKADLENNVDATSRTKFRLASISKVLTASLAARLVDDAIIDLDADIRDTLPNFPDKGAKITLRHLFAHLGGIRHYQAKDFDFDQPGGMIDTRPYFDHASILAIFADDPLIAAPGEKFQYTTFGFTLIGLVLEKATGKDYIKLLDEYVLTPAGAETILIDDIFSIIPDRAAPYDPIENFDGMLPPEMGPIVNSFFLNSAYKRAGGGMIGTPEDLVRYAALHFEPGFLSADIYEQMFTSQKNKAGEDIGYGLGWRIDETRDGRVYYHHRGTQAGARSY
ncbi:MAG: beta-lactamase family protein, partial [Marinicaulis sp.]|nr:beta-lactamase family protein [Marinicaulis sp.]